jgi:hypothetical protein
MIAGACVGCGACEPVCPSGGISRDGRTFAVDPALCSECVGFYHARQCARVCPVDCCVPDPSRVESEAVLFDRARRLHAGGRPAPRLGPETSHFRARERTLRSALREVRRRLGRALQGLDLPS